MKTNILAIGVLLLSASLSWAQQTSTISNDYRAWQKVTAIEQRLQKVNEAVDKPVLFAASDARSAQSSISLPTAGGARPIIFDRSYLTWLNNRNIKKPNGGYPRKYDLRSLGFVSPVKFQGDYGTCWAHAAMASIESWILKTENVTVDFSENHLVRKHGGDWEFAAGGNASMAEAYFVRWAGPVYESDDPYPNPNATVEPTTVRHVQRTRWIIPKREPLDNDTIKDALMNFGALFTSHYYTPESFAYNPNTAAYYVPFAKGRFNHAITIVGWDDDYPRENFTIQPPGNGAFIVKNSLSDAWGDEGYCYISYYDESLGYKDITSFSSSESIDSYATIYQYDPLGVVETIPTKWGANMFKASADDSISAVGFYALIPNTHYMISVYRNCEIGKPESGEVVVKNFNGHTDYAGFVTIPLPTAVDVKAETRFSIVLKLGTSPYPNPHAIETSIPGYSSAATASANQSFYSDNGNKWHDLRDWKIAANLCIKAYGKSAENVTPTLIGLQIEGVDSVASEESTSFTATASYSNNLQKTVVPVWSIPASAAAYAEITAEGVLTAKKVLSNTTIELQASYREGDVEKSVTKTVTITVAPPQCPQTISATLGMETTGVNIRWEAVEGADTYAIYRGPTENSANAAYCGTTTETQYFDIDVEPGVSYYYFIKAKNGTGSSAFTVAAEGWRALTAPSAVNASDGTFEGRIDLTWSASSGASHYRVYRAESLEDEPQPITEWITDFRYTDTAVEAERLYLYYVKAALSADGARASALSIVDDGFVFTPVVLRSIEIVGPASINAAATTAYACNAWYTDGTMKSSVQASWTLDGSEDVTLNAETGEVVTPIIAENRTFILQATYVEDGIEKAAQREVVILPIKPEAPSIFTVQSATTEQISLTWESVAGAAYYEIWRAGEADVTKATRVGSEVTCAYSDVLVTPGVTYYYWLKAGNSSGVSDISETYVSATRKLLAPTGVSATHGTDADKVTITWQAVQGARAYWISRAESVEGPYEVLAEGVTTLSYDDTSAEMGTEYYYTVQAASDAQGANLSVASAAVVGSKKIVHFPTALIIRGPATVFSEESAQYVAEVTYNNGDVLPAEGAWQVTDTSLATIDEAGLLTVQKVTVLQVVGLSMSVTIGEITLDATYEISLLPHEAYSLVKDVSVKPRWPWNGLVDIDYTIENYPENSFAFITLEGYDIDDERVLPATSLSGIGVSTPVTTGAYRITWDLGADYPNFHTTRFWVNLTSTPALLEVPSALTASKGEHENKVVLTWSPVENAIGYEVYRATSSVLDEAERIATVTALTYTDVAVVADVVYYYWVRASIGDFKSEFSSAENGWALQANQVKAADLYVATNGSDTTGTGTYDNPYATIQKALDVATEGAKICVLPGTYVENIEITGKHVYLFSEQGAKETVIRSTSAKRSVVTITASAEGTIVDGFTVTGGSGNYNPGNGDYYGGGFHCVTTATIQNCIITENNYSDLAFGGAIYNHSGTVTVENCLITKNYAWASGGASLTESEAGTIIFIGCTICENRSTSFFGYQGGVSLANQGNMQLINSIVWNNEGDDIGAFSSIYAQGTNLTITNSLIDGGFTAKRNIESLVVTGTNLSVNPQFNADYTLSENSPCIDAGVDASVKTESDLAGKVRIHGSKVDLGAYEYDAPTYVPMQSTYTIIYSANGGTGTMSTQTVVYNQPTALTPNGFTKAGYTFVGWATVADGECAYQDGATVLGLADKGQTITLYALWQEVEGPAFSWLYTIENGEVTITGVQGEMSGELIIPNEIEGLPVTQIAAEAFKGNQALVTIVVPDSVKTIGANAFADCSNLRDVTLPEDLELGGSSIPTNGLVAYYPFTNGTYVDETGNGHNIVYNGAQPATDRLGIVNNAYAFTGERIFFKTEATTETLYWDNFTYSVWAKTSVVVSEDGDSDGAWQAGNAILYPAHGGSNAGCGLAIGTNGVWLTEHGDCYLPKTLQYNAEIGTGWNHYAVTVDNNGAAKLYLNGQHVATASQSGRRKAICPTLIAGANHREIWGIFTGVADDYAFYNRALSPEEVAALYSGSGVINLQSIFSGCTSLQTITGCGFTVVTFDAGEGTLASEETTKIFRRGAAFGTLPTPTREGFKFMGWQTAQGKVVDQNTIVSDTNDGTLTATWAEMQRYDNLDEYIHSATPWTEQSSTTYDGVSAFQSGAISHNGTSSISIDVVGAGTLSFRWKVSSEGSWDFLRFYIDNVQQASISGSVGWEEKTYAIPAGTHTIKWAYTKDGSVNSNSDCGWLDCVTYVPDAEPPEVSDELYYVIDLSGGTSATSYPVTTLSAPPAEGWTDEYKTTKLVLRRIEAGSFLMNGTYDVTISQPFYMGVFEVTQKQYELVTGSNPSIYTGDMRPVENISWNAIRGNSDTHNWPSVTTVDTNSFIGKLRMKTGLTLDLPTEVQWEYACRAGTTSGYNNGGDTEADLALLGRYTGNQNDGRGGYSQHTVVGSYLPNAWGLYDMHGNIEEWGLDWYGTLELDTILVGPTSGYYRMVRGGGWSDDASICMSNSRHSGLSNNPPNSHDHSGFRLACPVAVVNTPEADVRLFTYSVANGEVTITGLTDDAYAGALVIPETIEGVPVTAIANNAFAGCEGVTSVTIPSSVISIGEDAFDGCSNITEVALPVLAVVNTPGFYEACFINQNTRYSLDTESSLLENNPVVVQEASKLYVTSLPEYTMYAYGTNMYFEGGVTYYFSAAYDDHSSVKVDNQMVVAPSSSECQVGTGNITFETSGWHWIDLRASNYGNVGGANTSTLNGFFWWTSSNSTKRRFTTSETNAIFCINANGTLANIFPESYDKLQSVELYGELSFVLNGFFDGCTSLQNVTGCGFTVVTFDAGEGTLASEETTKIFRRGTAFGALPTPTRDGFKFMGWQTAQGEVVDQNTIVSDTNDGTLTATWAEMLRYDNLDEYTHSATPWTEQSSTTYDGVSAFQSGAISHNGTSSISIDVVGSGTLSFRWKVSSEGSYDYLRFYIDNVQQASISGSVGWEEKTYTISAGTHTLKWAYTKDGSVNSNSDCGWLDCVSYVPDAEPPEVNDALYYVIDLSGGTSATSYPVTTLAAPPAGGWTDEYKTTKLVLRRIEAGSFLMNGIYDVTISQPFYMGVFEVTQKQYELVTGSNPSIYTGDMRPVENVSWNAIRGNSDTYNWPSVTTVDLNSFMGKIRAKTGLTLDLPTEAQSEYACRAGTTSDYNNGGSTDADLALLGRYWDNGGSSNQHAVVGSYLPNAWGLYDMHGNVWEWCLDYWSGSLSSSTDPKGPTSGSSRVLRGGVWYDLADDCTSSSRDYIDPSYSIDGYDGFRLACPVGL